MTIDVRKYLNAAIVRDRIEIGICSYQCGLEEDDGLDWISLDVRITLVIYVEDTYPPRPLSGIRLIFHLVT
jgi:hypothetical protein